ncbi:putative Glycogen debranching enzyme [Hyella patelloides LEGE 07179]|uniref:Putative Glycogen debranching enzyme n=1 Tax=Hyella patelloides LEGE 07179 TaxID=945734 RepID=A0A563VXX0_9CYAN|nr:amylo-alpha-1,6-glucosidase [Hyella patelloides]VEP16292.1 putative Glycogen debranching enzyme [Hyella patelloides LEGE 07179]
MNLKFGREVCNNPKIAESREWLITNGIGGFASGTISGVLTRHYHGLLVGALKPPVARTLLLTKLDETVNYNGQFYDLSTNRWADGTVAPEGYLNIESFHLEGTTPVWHFAFADGLLEKRIWMQQGENTTYIRYSYKRGSQPLNLSLKALVNYRDYHGGTHVKDLPTGSAINSRAIPLRPPETESEKTDGGGIYSLRVKAFPNAENLYISAITKNWSNNFNWSIDNTWYQNFALAVEEYRGLDATEDHLLASTGSVILQPGDSLTIIASTSDRWSAGEYRKTWGNNQIGEKSQQKKTERDRQLIDLFYDSNSLNPTPDNPNPNHWIEQLVLATEQFIVDRPLTDNPEGKTIIAGYPWFTDWGRDTMISLPGLTISTGRYDIAKTILRTFAKYIDKGMLPNVFPDAGETPHYNTVDATLWYFEAIRAYYAATKDRELLVELFPLLAEIIDWHIKGTRYNIKMDDDGLLYAGESGVQLTWMDAKVGDWVVTPRIGKPVEVNALWYNALVCIDYFSDILSKSASKYQEMVDNTRSHFSKFWYEEGGYCYDVIDSPDGNDTSFRPNQIFAVSLPDRGISRNAPIESPLQPEQQRMVVDKVGQKLLTSYGLLSLATDNPDYVGIYGGNQLQRDGSYHQGTTWGWLIGHFIQAHLRVYKNPELARSFLLPMANHLRDGCIGSISEIFDGDAPFTPRGCFAQAWSVAEVLRSWLITINN